MATYKELHGIAVQDVSSDPTTTGELFYNSTTDSFRAVIQSSAWFAQSPTTTQHGDGAGCGPTTTCVIWGGYSPDAPPVTNATEEFNGTGWTNGGNYPFSGFGATGAAGTLTAALGMGGRNAPPAGTSSNVTAEYDGTSWTTGNNTPDARYGLAGIGSQTAAVGFGGNNRADAAPSNPDGSGTRNDTFEYDGTNWTTGNNYPISVSTAGSCGSQTAAVSGGGGDRTDGSGVNTSCTYDGTNWTAVSNINTARGAVRQSGNQTSALLFGPGTQTESWDGSSWTTAPSLAGGGYGGSSGHNNNPAGSTSALLAARRDGSNYPKNTEEFATSTTVTTPSAFASGGNSSNAYYGRNGYGTQTAGLMFGGTTGGGVVYNKTEEYDGSSWTAGGNLPSARSSMGAAGTQTAGMANGGYLGNPPGAYTDQSLSYDGSSWSSLPTMATTFSAGASNGVLTSAIVSNGSADLDGVQQYNGSSWTSASNAPFSKNGLTGSGVGANEDDLLVAGGTEPASPAIVATSHIYNGSSWTATNNLVVAREGQFQFGTTSSAIGAGGNKTVGTGDKQTNAMVWDGTTWATSPSLSIGRSSGARGGTFSAGLVCGGYPYSPSPHAISTEEFTGETTAVNVKTVTTS